jgi:predicted transcriptional regulator
MSRREALPTELYIAAQMLLESFPARTIEFYCKIFSNVSQRRAVSLKEMAEMYGCTPQAAAKHVGVLTARGYLRRLHYRAWRIEERKIAPILAYTQKNNRFGKEVQNEKESNPPVRQPQRQTA